MKSLLFFALIFAGGPAFATGTLKECQAKAEEKPKDCAKDAAAVKAQSDAAAKAANASCEATRHGNDVSVPTCSTDFARANEASKSFYDSGLIRCEDMAKECDDKCTPNASVKPPEKTKMANLKKQCRQKIEQTKSDLKKGGSGNKTGSDGGDKTSDQAKGNGSAPNIPPMSPQQSKDDEEKTDATQPQSTPQQTASTPQEEKKEESKDGKSGFDDDSKTQSADAACSGGKFMCPGCPGFLQKCPNGDASACISKMSSSDQNIISSNCGVSSGSSTAQALTNPSTPQSLMSGGVGGSSGGTTGTVSGGMDTQSMLEDGKKNDTETHAGRKEGGSLGTESAGGGGSGSSDSFGSSGDLFGDSGSASALNMNKAVPRSLASAFQSGAGDSKVVDRYGPNLFSILGETIKGRCDRNLLLHCPNRK
jgi:hypothetical protein